MIYTLKIGCEEVMEASKAWPGFKPHHRNSEETLKGYVQVSDMTGLAFQKDHPDSCVEYEVKAGETGAEAV